MAEYRVVYNVISRQSYETLASFETFTRARGWREAGKKTDAEANAYFRAILCDPNAHWTDREASPVEPNHVLRSPFPANRGRNIRIKL